ncbi:MAG: hypothetical protein JSS11_05375 [Verrucomicrobia bacterium]|nr:hypothetical protein [Verrucomicrobiota bacterium]
MIVHNIMADASGRIWYSATGEFGWLVADSRGVLRAQALHVQLPPADREVGHVLRMQVLGGDAYFVTQGARGFVAHADAQGRVTEIALPAGQRAVSLFTAGNAMHVITNAGVFRIAGDRLTAVPAAQALVKAGVLAVWPQTAAEGGGHWVASIDGLRAWRGDAAPLVSEEVKKILAGDRVSCGCPLGDGTVALGTERHGVLIVQAAEGRVLARYDDDGRLGRTSSTVVAVTPDAAGGLWLARYAGVTRIQVQSPAAKHDGPDGVRGRVQGFAMYRGQLHVATTQGVFRRDPATGRFLEMPEASGDSWVLLPTEDGLIIGGPDLRLVRPDGTVEIIEAERLLFRSALRLRRDPDRIVACTGPGLVRIYRRTDGRWRLEAGLPRVRASLYPIFEDKEGFLWMTRNRMELRRLDFRAGVNFNAETEVIGPEHGLPLTAADRQRVTISLVDGEIEVATPEGIWRRDPASDRFVPETRIEGLDPARWSRIFPLSDGRLWLLNTREADPSAIAKPAGPGRWVLEPLPYTGLEAVRPIEVCDDPATRTVWLGYLGLASYELGWTGGRAPPPRARLRAISAAGGRVLWGGAGLRFGTPLRPDENSLRFTFAALVLQPDAFGGTAVEFRTRLEGFDREWSEWSNDTARDYSNLPPGRFVLHIQARDGAQRAGPDETFAFTLLPPWWRTWWFNALAVLTGVGVVVAITRWTAIRVLQRRLALLEAQAGVERERLRLARDLHDDIGSGLGRVILFAGEASRHKSDATRLDAALDRVRGTAQELVQHAREIVWAVSPQHDSLASLIERLTDYTEETLRAAGIACRLAVPPEVPALTLGSEVRHNLFLAVKEAVHNCVKYSGAGTAEFTVQFADGWLTVMLRDHGRGFAPGEKRGSGHGLANLALRAEALGGTAAVASEPGRGATVTLRVPLTSGRSPETPPAG